MLLMKSGRSELELKRENHKLHLENDRLVKEITVLRESIKRCDTTQEMPSRFDTYPERIPWTRFYDTVVYVRKFSDLWGKRGWPIKSTHHAKSLCDWTMPIVTVCGEFGKGKSYTLNMLTGANLPSGKHIETKGLSFKHHILDQREILLLDQQGTNSPLYDFSEQNLVHRKLEESFLQDVTFEVSDVFILVVNKISCSEQDKLLKLCQAIQSSDKPFKKVIVLHNFKDFRHIEDMKRGVKDIFALYSQTVRCRQEMECEGERRVITYLEGRSHQTLKSSQSHFFVGKAGSEAGKLNNWVYKKIRSIILDGMDIKGDGRTLEERLIQSFTRHLPKYVGTTTYIPLTLLLQGDENLSEDLPIISEVPPEVPFQFHCTGSTENEREDEFDRLSDSWKISTGSHLSADAGSFNASKKQPRTSPCESEVITDADLWSARAKRSQQVYIDNEHTEKEGLASNCSTEDTVQLLKFEMFRLQGEPDDFFVIDNNPNTTVVKQDNAIMDIYERENGNLMIELELAGTPKQNITVKGIRHPPSVKIGIVPESTTSPRTIIKQQRRLQKTQEIEVPEGFDVGTLKKHYKDGLLVIEIQRFVNDTIDVDWS